MKRERTIGSICYDLRELDTFEFTDLLNDLIESTVADIGIPKIHHMKELKDFKNERVYSFNKNLNFFIINKEQKLESIVSPLELIKYEEVADFILGNDINTNHGRIDAIVNNYWNDCDAIENFLKNLPDSSLSIIWNEYQKEIGKTDFVHQKESSDKLRKLISLYELYKYYG